jgi:hypothetical protein
VGCDQQSGGWRGFGRCGGLGEGGQRAGVSIAGVSIAADRDIEDNT